MADDLWSVYGTNPPISMLHILSAQEAMCADALENLRFAIYDLRFTIYDLRFAIAFWDLGID